MSNFFGNEVVESFILIVPAGMQIHKKSEEHTSSVQIDGYDIYVWKKHIPEAQKNVVSVSLKSPVE
jgi:hypothetical protein